MDRLPIVDDISANDTDIFALVGGGFGSPLLDGLLPFKNSSEEPPPTLTVAPDDDSAVPAGSPNVQQAADVMLPAPGGAHGDAAAPTGDHTPQNGFNTG